MGSESGDGMGIVKPGAAASRRPRPEWLKVRLPAGESYARIKRLVRLERLHTVCEGARCPNIGECWGAGTATFLILGDTCTRACRFCAVKTGRPPEYDLEEPARVAAAIARLQLKYAVVTSVDRDDLADGGAHIFAETIRLTREACPDTKIEVLIPDFRGNADSLRRVVGARPDVLAHNVETVPRLYPIARSGSRYRRSLGLLRQAKELDPSMRTKSSLMLGLGERMEEAVAVMTDLRGAGVDQLTLGQYLQPTREQLPVDRYYTPGEFQELQALGVNLGFLHVASGPLVRSSYHADRQHAALPVAPPAAPIP